MQNKMIQEIELCKKRYCEERLLDVTSRPECLDTMTDGGFWNDLTYDGKTESCAFRHPTRLLEIAKAVYNPESELYGSKEALAKLELGILFWVKADIRFNNWWYNNNGVPGNFADIMLAAGSLVSADVEKAAFRYLEDKILENERTAKNGTGTNIYTRERIRLAFSLYANDYERLRDVFAVVSSSIKMVTKEGPESDYKKRIWNSYIKLDHLPDTLEGMQADYSFMQHGPLLLSGSYGKELVCIMASFLSYANGTSLIDPENLADFIDMLLEHYRWLVRNNTLDYTVGGRSIASDGPHSSARNARAVYNALRLLSELDTLPRQDEIKEFYAASQKEEPPVIGTRYFWKSDHTACQHKNYLLTVRASSNRTIASEQVNMENLLCDYLGDGVSYIYRDGKEYDSIFPVWDWRKIPGTTALLRELKPQMIQHRAIRGSESDDAGGVTDGYFGASAMQLVRGGLRAKKAWFMFDGEFLALGTDIENSTEHSCITTINQSLLRSDISVCSENGEIENLPCGAEHKRTARWVNHDKIGYFFPENTNIKIAKEPSKQGDQRRINWHGAYELPAKPEPKEKDVFTLWHDHTESGNNSYEYIVRPQLEANETDGKNPYSYIKVLSNTESLQAVSNSNLKLISAVFWRENETVKADCAMSVSADKRVLLQLREDGDELILAVASLSAKAECVKITINRPLSGVGVISDGDVSTLNVSLPDGEYRGSSVVLKLNI